MVATLTGRGVKKDWCQGAESNCRHRGFQPRALPTELPWRAVDDTESAMAGATAIIRPPLLPALAMRPKRPWSTSAGPQGHGAGPGRLSGDHLGEGQAVRAEGLEPPTFGLKGRCSAVELRPANDSVAKLYPNRRTYCRDRLSSAPSGHAYGAVSRVSPGPKVHHTGVPARRGSSQHGTPYPNLRKYILVLLVLITGRLRREPLC